MVALFLVVAAVVTLLVATEAIDPDFLPGGSVEAPSDSWFYEQLNGVADFSGGDQAVTVVVTMAVALAMLLGLFLELRTLRPRERTLPISATHDGILTVEESSVRLLAERTGISNRSISSLRCRIGVRGNPPTGGPASIIIACYPRLILGSDVREVGEDLRTRIKDAVQQLTGLTVLRVNVVRVRYDRNDDKRLISA